MHESIKALLLEVNAASIAQLRGEARQAYRGKPSTQPALRIDALLTRSVTVSETVSHDISLMPRGAVIGSAVRISQAELSKDPQDVLNILLALRLFFSMSVCDKGDPFYSYLRDKLTNLELSVASTDGSRPSITDKIDACLAELLTLKPAVVSQLMNEVIGTYKFDKDFNTAVDFLSNKVFIDRMKSVVVSGRAIPSASVTPGEGAVAGEAEGVGEAEAEGAGAVEGAGEAEGVGEAEGEAEAEVEAEVEGAGEAEVEAEGVGAGAGAVEAEAEGAAASGNTASDDVDFSKRFPPLLDAFCCALVNLPAILKVLSAKTKGARPESLGADLAEVIKDSPEQVTARFKEVSNEGSTDAYFSNFSVRLSFFAMATSLIGELSEASAPLLHEDEGRALADLQPLVSLLNDYAHVHLSTVAALKAAASDEHTDPAQQAAKIKAKNYRELDRIFKLIKAEAKRLSADNPQALAIYASGYTRLDEMLTDEYANQAIIDSCLADQHRGFLMQNEEGYLVATASELGVFTTTPAPAKKSYLRTEELLPDAIKVDDASTITFSKQQAHYAKVQYALQKIVDRSILFHAMTLYPTVAGTPNARIRRLVELLNEFRGKTSGHDSETSNAFEKFIYAFSEELALGTRELNKVVLLVDAASYAVQGFALEFSVKMKALQPLGEFLSKITVPSDASENPVRASIQDFFWLLMPFSSTTHDIHDKNLFQNLNPLLVDALVTQENIDGLLSPAGDLSYQKIAEKVRSLLSIKRLIQEGLVSARLDLCDNDCAALLLQDFSESLEARLSFVTKYASYLDPQDVHYYLLTGLNAKDESVAGKSRLLPEGLIAQNNQLLFALSGLNLTTSSIAKILMYNEVKLGNEVIYTFETWSAAITALIKYKTAVYEFFEKYGCFNAVIDDYAAELAAALYLSTVDVSKEVVAKRVTELDSLFRGHQTSTSAADVVKSIIPVVVEGQSLPRAYVEFFLHGTMNGHSFETMKKRHDFLFPSPSSETEYNQLTTLQIMQLVFLGYYVSVEGLFVSYAQYEKSLSAQGQGLLRGDEERALPPSDSEAAVPAPSDSPASAGAGAGSTATSLSLKPVHTLLNDLRAAVEVYLEENSGNDGAVRAINLQYLLQQLPFAEVAPSAAAEVSVVAVAAGAASAAGSGSSAAAGVVSSSDAAMSTPGLVNASTTGKAVPAKAGNVVPVFAISEDAIAVHQAKITQILVMVRALLGIKKDHDDKFLGRSEFCDAVAAALFTEADGAKKCIATPRTSAATVYAAAFAQWQGYVDEVIRQEDFDLLYSKDTLAELKKLIAEPDLDTFKAEVVVFDPRHRMLLNFSKELARRLAREGLSAEARQYYEFADQFVELLHLSIEQPGFLDRFKEFENFVLSHEATVSVDPEHAHNLMLSLSIIRSMQEDLQFLSELSGRISECAKEFVEKAQAPAVADGSGASESKGEEGLDAVPASRTPNSLYTLLGKFQDLLSRAQPGNSFLFVKEDQPSLATYLNKEQVDTDSIYTGESHYLDFLGKSESKDLRAVFFPEVDFSATPINSEDFSFDDLKRQPGFDAYVTYTRLCYLARKVLQKTALVLDTFALLHLPESLRFSGPHQVLSVESDSKSREVHRRERNTRLCKYLNKVSAVMLGYVPEIFPFSSDMKLGHVIDPADTLQDIASALAGTVSVASKLFGDAEDLVAEYQSLQLSDTSSEISERFDLENFLYMQLQTGFADSAPSSLQLEVYGETKVYLSYLLQVIHFVKAHGVVLNQEEYREITQLALSIRDLRALAYVLDADKLLSAFERWKEIIADYECVKVMQRVISGWLSESSSDELALWLYVQNIRHHEQLPVVTSTEWNAEVWKSERLTEFRESLFVSANISPELSAIRQEVEAYIKENERSDQRRLANPGPTYDVHSTHVLLDLNLRFGKFIANLVTGYQSMQVGDGFAVFSDAIKAQHEVHRVFGNFADVFAFGDLGYRNEIAQKAKEIAETLLKGYCDRIEQYERSAFLSYPVTASDDEEASQASGVEDLVGGVSEDRSNVSAVSSVVESESEGEGKGKVIDKNAVTVVLAGLQFRLEALNMAFKMVEAGYADKGKIAEAAAEIHLICHQQRVVDVDVEGAAFADKRIAFLTAIDVRLQLLNCDFVEPKDLYDLFVLPNAQSKSRVDLTSADFRHRALLETILLEKFTENPASEDVPCILNSYVEELSDFVKNVRAYNLAEEFLNNLGFEEGRDSIPLILDGYKRFSFGNDTALVVTLAALQELLDYLYLFAGDAADRNAFVSSFLALGAEYVLPILVSNVGDAELHTFIPGLKQFYADRYNAVMALNQLATLGNLVDAVGSAENTAGPSRRGSDVSHVSGRSYTSQQSGLRAGMLGNRVAVTPRSLPHAPQFLFGSSLMSPVGYPTPGQGGAGAGAGAGAVAGVGAGGFWLAADVPVSGLHQVTPGSGFKRRL